MPFCSLINTFNPYEHSRIPFSSTNRQHVHFEFLFCVLKHSTIFKNTHKTVYTAYPFTNIVTQRVMGHPSYDQFAVSNVQLRQSYIVHFMVDQLENGNIYLSFTICNICTGYKSRIPPSPVAKLPFRRMPCHFPDLTDPISVVVPFRGFCYVRNLYLYTPWNIFPISLKFRKWYLDVCKIMKKSQRQLDQEVTVYMTPMWLKITMEFICNTSWESTVEHAETSVVFTEDLKLRRTEAVKKAADKWLSFVKARRTCEIVPFEQCKRRRIGEKEGST